MENIKLDKDKKVNLYIQLYRQIKNAILEKKLKPNAKLKPIRQMADDLDINPATVVKAYNLLEMEELIYKKVGSGSYVSPLMESVSVQNLDNKSNSELDMMEYGQVMVNSEINFASATPTPDLFPVDDFKNVINQVLDRDGGEAFVYQKSQGYHPLRETLYSNLMKDKINTTLNNIMVVSGAQQAIDLISKVLINYTDTVLVSEYSYSAAKTAFRNRGANIRSVTLENDGMNLEEIKDILEKTNISLVYMMSSFQNPTGITWSDDKKEELLKLASKHDFYIIEDDCLSELYYHGDKPVPIKSLDRDNRVIYIKSYSKLFMPGLRLGFMVLPNKILTPVLAAKYFTDISSSGLTQRAFDLYIRNGFWEKHLKRMRVVFNRRFYLMKEKIRYFPVEISLISGPKGGLYFWLALPEDLSSDAFYLMAAKNGVAFLPGRAFSVNNKPTKYFRLSFAAAGDKKIKAGMDVLVRLAGEFIERGESSSDYMPLL